ncbi:MAG: hypothetical protein ABEH81_01275 [Halopenitus sp.]
MADEPHEVWHDCVYPAEGRIKPLNKVEEGLVDYHVLEREDGELEIIEPDDMRYIEMANEKQRVDVKIPIRELVERERGKSVEWAGVEEIPAKLVMDHMRESVIAIEFPQTEADEVIEASEIPSYNLLVNANIIKGEK